EIADDRLAGYPGSESDPEERRLGQHILACARRKGGEDGDEDDEVDRLELQRTGRRMEDPGWHVDGLVQRRFENDQTENERHDRRVSVRTRKAVEPREHNRAKSKGGQNQK